MPEGDIGIIDEGGRGGWGGAGSLLKNGAPEMVHTLFAVVPDKDAEFFTAGADGESSGSLSAADMLHIS
jgi:hypothetical protein